MEVNINLKSKYNIGDKVYFIWPGNRHKIIEAIVIGIKPHYGDNSNEDVFTFSYTLANALMLILDALMFILFPKVISKLSSEDITEVILDEIGLLAGYPCNWLEILI